MEGECDSDITPYQSDYRPHVRKAFRWPTRSSASHLMLPAEDNLEQPLLVTEACECDLPGSCSGQMLLAGRARRRRHFREHSFHAISSIPHLLSGPDASSYSVPRSSILGSALFSTASTVSETNPQTPSSGASQRTQQQPAPPPSAGAANSHRFLLNCIETFADPTAVKDSLKVLCDDSTLLPSELVSVATMSEIREAIASFATELSKTYAATDDLNIYQKRLLAELIKRFHKFFLQNSRRYEPTLLLVRSLWPFLVYLTQLSDKAICDAVSLQINAIASFYNINVMKRINEYLQAAQKAQEEEVEAETEAEKEKDKYKAAKIPSIENIISTLPPQALLHRFCDLAFRQPLLQTTSSKLVCNILELCNKIVQYYPDLRFFINGSVSFESLQALPLSMKSLELAKLTSSKVFLIPAQRVYRKYGDSLGDRDALDEITVALYDYYFTVIRNLGADLQPQAGAASDFITASQSHSMSAPAPEVLKQEQPKETIADMFYQRGKGINNAVINAINMLKARARDDDDSRDAGDNDNDDSDDDEAAVAEELARLMAAPPRSDDSVEEDNSGDSGNGNGSSDDRSSGSDAASGHASSSEPHNCADAAADQFSGFLPSSLCPLEMQLTTSCVYGAEILSISGAATEAAPDTKADGKASETHGVEQEDDPFIDSAPCSIGKMREIRPGFAKTWMKRKFIDDKSLSLNAKMLSMCSFLKSIVSFLNLGDNSGASLLEDEEDMLSQSIEALVLQFRDLVSPDKKLDSDVVYNFLGIFSHCMDLGFIGEFEVIDFNTFLLILQKISLCTESLQAIHKYMKSMSLLQSESIRESLVHHSNKIYDFILIKLKSFDDTFYLNSPNSTFGCDNYFNDKAISRSRISGPDLLSGMARSLRNTIERQCGMTVYEFASSCLIEHECLNCVILELVMRSQKDFATFLTSNLDILLQILCICRDNLSARLSATSAANQVDIAAMNRMSYFLLLLFVVSLVDGEVITQAMRPLLAPQAAASAVTSAEGDDVEKDQSTASKEAATGNKFTLDNLVFLMHTYMQCIAKQSQQYSTDKSIIYVLSVINKQPKGTTKTIRIPFELFRNRLDGAPYFVDGTNIAKLLVIMTEACYTGLFEKSYLYIAKLKVRSDAGGIARRLLTTGHIALASMKSLSMDLYDRIKLMTAREKLENLCYVDKAIPRILLASLFLDKVARNRIPVSGSVLESLLMTLEYLVHKKLLMHICDPPDGDAVLSSDLFWFPAGIKSKLTTFIVSLFSLSKHPITMTFAYALYGQLELQITDLAEFYSALEKLPNFRYINMSEEEIARALEDRVDPEAAEIVDPNTLEQAPLSLLSQQVQDPTNAKVIAAATTLSPQGAVNETNLRPVTSNDTLDQTNYSSADRMSIFMGSQSTCIFQYQAQITYEEYSPLAQLFHRSFIHVVIAMIFGLGNWKCAQLGQFLYLPAEKVVQLQSKTLSIPDKLILLNSLAVILGEVEAIGAFIPLVQQTLPIITMLSGCLAHIDEAIYLGNEPIIRTLLRGLLPGDIYFSLVRPVSASQSQQHTVMASLTNKFSSSLNGSSFAPRPLSSSVTSRSGYYMGKYVAAGREELISLKTKQAVMTCIRMTIVSTIQAYASSMCPQHYAFYDIYTNELVQLSALEICSVYLIGWLRVTQTLTLCYDTALTAQLLTILSHFSQLRYSVPKEAPPEEADNAHMPGFGTFASSSSTPTLPLMGTNSGSLRPPSSALSTRGNAVAAAGPPPPHSHSSIPGLFAPNFNTVSLPFISLLFPAITFDGAVSNFLGWVIYHFLLVHVKSGGLEDLLYKAHLCGSTISSVNAHTRFDLSTSLRKYLDALTEFFGSQMENVMACKNICSIACALSSTLQYDLVQLPEKVMEYSHDLPAHILQKMLMGLPNTVCSTGDLIFDAEDSGSKLAKITIPLSPPLGVFSTPGCFIVDTSGHGMYPAVTDTDSKLAEEEENADRGVAGEKAEDSDSVVLTVGSKMVDVYIPVLDAPVVTHYSYLSADSTLLEVWQNYQTFLASDYNEYFYLQSHAIIDPACVHSRHFGMLFAIASYNLWIRMLLDPLFRRSVLVQHINNQSDPYYSLFAELQHAYRLFCFEATHLSSAWFGGDIIAIARILRVPGSEIDDEDIAQRKHLSLLKRLCIYIDSSKETLRPKSVADEPHSHLAKQIEALDTITEHSIIDISATKSSTSDELLPQSLLIDLVLRSREVYNEVALLGALSSMYTNGRATFMFSFKDKLFMFRHLMRLSSNCYMAEQTMNENMVEATKYVPMKNTTMEITVRRDAPLQSLVEYLDQNFAGSQAALQKPWRVAFVDEHALDLHGPRQEYMNLVTRDLMSRCQAFSRKTYLPKVRKIGRGALKRQADYLEYVALTYLISRAITEFLSLSFDVPLTLLRRALGVPFTHLDIMYASPEMYYGNLISLLNVDKIKFEDCIGIDISCVPCDEDIDAEYSTIKCADDTMEHVSAMVAEIVSKRSVPVNVVAKLIQRSLPKIDIRLFTPVELGLIVSGVSRLSAEELIPLFTWMHPPADAASPTVSQAVEAAFAKVIRELSGEDLAEFMCFITGSNRIPPNGFEPPLKIQRLLGDGETPETKPEDIDAKKLRLPSASTCFHSLKLPPYCDAAMLKQRLQVSMSEGKAFEFA